MGQDSLNIGKDGMNSTGIPSIILSCAVGLIGAGALFIAGKYVMQNPAIVEKAMDMIAKNRSKIDHLSSDPDSSSNSVSEKPIKPVE